MKYDFDKPICEMEQGDIVEFYDAQTIIDRILIEKGEEIYTTKLYIYKVDMNLIHYYIDNKGFHPNSSYRQSSYDTCIWGIDENGEIRLINIDHYMIGNFKVISHIKWCDIIERIFQVGDMGLTEEQKWDAEDREESYKYFKRT